MLRKMIEQRLGINGMSTIENGALVRFNKDDLIDGVYIMPKNVTVIKQYAFNNMAELKKVILPKTIKRIECLAFYNCGLEEIVVPEGITEIETATFAKCSNLTKVVLPTTLKYIRTNAFAWCDSLEQIEVPKHAVVSKDAFGDSPKEVIYQDDLEVTR